ncbi:hypothetical protein [Aminirod propionatiphilus]|uniref:Uncharacterized protein n=1 Tax=Aminirod propionatiphilus TaxID=3415223 RepID=A0ACD1DVU4_9BACT|nr:hypothetical protein KIH16_00335 [Synergistota bacterium]
MTAQGLFQLGLGDETKAVAPEVRPGDDVDEDEGDDDEDKSSQQDARFA